MTHALNLKNFSFAELFDPQALSRLDENFLNFLNQHNAALCEQLLAYRSQPPQNMTPALSDMLIACAIHLDHFIAELFDIEDAAALSQAQTIQYNPIAAFKKYFVLKRAKKEASRLALFLPFSELQAWLKTALATAAVHSNDQELSVALLAQQWLQKPEQHHAEIEKLVQWCSHVLFNEEAKSAVQGWVSFMLPARTDYQHLIKGEPTEWEHQPALCAASDSLRYRDGFDLTDRRMDAKQIQDEVNYCIYCHDHAGDFCSRGFPHKKGVPELGFKKNPLEVTLSGCPLEEKISEMHYLKREGHTIAALAMVMVDNPMCPATGHRICNDCMKACIYQKQDPVNIPEIETRVLTDALNLPWGVEIYDLLTRWNPLRAKQWVIKPYNGLKVMIAGMGPAGFTLAHHLLMEGFAVVGFDGLKIEPLAANLIHQPISAYQDIIEPLDERIMAGFGGVAEYGITVRWDKNFLKLIYLSLMRRKHFQVFGSIRFGGTITIEKAWELGFDHFVVAVGAGLPKALSIPNSLATGMRQANDFLMALQLGSAASKHSLTSLQLELPALIIGGGLTGVDTATEVQAYYINQVEKIYHRFTQLAQHFTPAALQAAFDAEGWQTLQKFLAHGQAVIAERQRATAAGEPANFIKLLQAWGGVAIAYRRGIQDSPAYINNHEEIQKALEEGIYYLPGVDPCRIDLDAAGHVQKFIGQRRKLSADNEWIISDEIIALEVKSIFVATGTQPNTAYEFEHRGTFNRVNLQYQHYEDINHELVLAHGVKDVKDPAFGAFTSYQHHDRRVSLIGDTHPVFHGNVVKAIASGMRTYPKILELFTNRLNDTGSQHEYQQFAEAIKHHFQAKLISKTWVASKTLKIVIQAPAAAARYQAGHFFRLQNFITSAPEIEHTKLFMEPLALTAAACHADCLTFYVNTQSANAQLVDFINVGDAVSLMGPAGVKAKIPNGQETILLITQHQGLPFTLSYAAAATAAGNKVLYIGLFDNDDDLYCLEELLAVTEACFWLTPNAQIKHLRPQDSNFTTAQGLESALKAWAQPRSPQWALADTDRVYVLGNAAFLKKIQKLRQHLLKDLLPKAPSFVGSVYGGMQCMLKGVCAQCLQWQVDPDSGKRTKAVFACSWQDQPLEIIDLQHLEERQQSSSVMEPLNQLWLQYLRQPS